MLFDITTRPLCPFWWVRLKDEMNSATEIYHPDYPGEVEKVYLGVAPSSSSASSLLLAKEKKTGRLLNMHFGYKAALSGTVVHVFNRSGNVFAV
jgi:hypothetical protein